MNEERASRLFAGLREHSTGPVSDPALRADVAQWVREAAGSTDTRFQKHPFGFLKATLGECMHEGTTAVFRLHVWHPTIRYEQSPQPLCHSHAWHLASYVLRGPLTNTDFRHVPAAQPPLYKLFHVFVDTGTVTVARPTEELVGAEIIGGDRLTDHCVYHVERGVLHTTSADHGTFAVTLAILHDRAAVPVMNLRRADECEAAPFDQSFLVPEDNRRVKDDILGLLMPANA